MTSAIFASIKRERLFIASGQTASLGLIQTSGGSRIPGRHLPKRVFDDRRGVEADAELPKENGLPVPGPEEIFIPLRCPVPALVLNKPLVAAEIHRHGRSAYRTCRNAFRRNSHIPLRSCHAANGGLIVVGLIVTRFRTLPKSVIALGVKEPFFVKAGALKLVIHIGGQHEVILIVDQGQQFLIYPPGRAVIAVYQNLPRPPGPVFLKAFIRIKSAGIHIMKAVLGFKIRKVLPKPFTAVIEPRRR